MSESPAKKRGCFGTLVSLVLLVTTLGLATALFYVFQPQDLSDIGGYATKQSPMDRDMRVVLENSLNRGYPLPLDEEQLNAWIKKSLDLHQGGMFSGMVDLKGVWVRMEDDRAEVVMERSVLGKPFTVSIFLTINEESGELKFDGGSYFDGFSKPLKGGRFGKLVVPQGFLLLVLPAYKDLAQALEHEIGIAREMSVVKFEGDHILLQPRAAEDPGFFQPKMPF